MSVAYHQAQKVRYGIRPRTKMKKGGKADMITAKMSKKKKGKMMKGKR